MPEENQGMNYLVYELFGRINPKRFLIAQFNEVDDAQLFLRIKKSINRTSKFELEFKESVKL